MSARLTFVATNGDWFIPGIDLKECNSSEYGALMKLKRYEDIGYSPDELEELLGKEASQLTEAQRVRRLPIKELANTYARPEYCTPEFCPCCDDKCDPLGCNKAVEKWLNSHAEKMIKEAKR